ncbi:hypothetical protein GCM10007863_07010 [Dyella mobilis]|nr:hypothetical protein GCM10007863_07010 [Dyella mobilis]
MHEDIRAIVAADKAETLGIVEPLNGTDLTIRHETHSKTRFFNNERLDHPDWGPAYWCAKENPRG